MHVSNILSSLSLGVYLAENMGQCASSNSKASKKNDASSPVIPPSVEKVETKTIYTKNEALPAASDIKDVVRIVSSSTDIVETNTAVVENSSTGHSGLQLNQLEQVYGTIIMNADSPINRSSTEKLYEQLYSGVYLDHKKQRFWIDKMSGLSSFMVFATGLTICWGENPKYWSWSTYKQQDGVEVEMAKLETVCWFEVNGKLDISLLSQGTRYEVVYMIKLDVDASGWTNPIYTEFHVQGIVRKKHLNLLTKPQGQWIELQVGEFDMSAGMTGDVFFRIGGTESLRWKSGFLIKGVVVRPKREV